MKYLALILSLIAVLLSLVAVFFAQTADAETLTVEESLQIEDSSYEINPIYSDESGYVGEQITTTIGDTTITEIHLTEEE